MKSFSNALASAGFEKKKSGTVIYLRIALKTLSVAGAIEQPSADLSTLQFGNDDDL